MCAMESEKKGNGSIDPALEKFIAAMIDAEIEHLTGLEKVLEMHD